MKLNIDIGEDMIDIDGSCCRVTNIHTTSISVSIELLILKKTNKGIDSTQWYAFDRSFKERFRWGLEGYLDFINKSSYEKIKHYFKTKDILNK
jgi:hypothetical protein